MSFLKKVKAVVSSLRLFPQFLKHNGFINLSFSQEGEDLVLFRLIGNRSKGFYIDVGAHHPMRFSNTYKFYLMGWNGINIDPLPGSSDLFNKVRSRDINLELPISDKPGSVLVYHMFDDAALNTFDSTLADQYVTTTHYKLINRVSIKSFTLSEILDKYLPKDQKIDFLSIDVEGLDMAVLRSNNWAKYRPEYLVVESLETRIENISTLEVSLFLKELGFVVVSKTVNSLIFKSIR